MTKFLFKPRYSLFDLGAITLFLGLFEAGQPWSAFILLTLAAITSSIIEDKIQG